MNDYFYYFGFLYLIDVLNSLRIAFKPVKKENVIHLHEGMEMTELMDATEKMKPESASYKSILTGIIFWVWSLSGYLLNLPEKNWFLFDVIFSAAC